MKKKWYQAETAVVTGQVSVEEGVSVWHNATLRADTAPITIGRNSNVQDNVCIHAGDGYPVNIGENVTVGHGAILHGCTIADDTIIGMGAIVMNGAYIGKQCLVGAGALVTQGMEVEDGSLVLGSPAKQQRIMTEKEIAHNRENALHYVKAGREQLKEQDVEDWYSAKLKNGYERLAKNLMDFIWEEQVKLGYRREVIRLYFPLASLCHFFGRQMSEEEMLDVMHALPETVTRTLGNVRCSSKKERFCIEIPEDGVAYVHEHMHDDGFLEELVALVQTHECSREKLLSLFGKYSQAVEIWDMQDADFDYAIHCKDRGNDPYYYCFHEEGCHIIYHRFTLEDYADLIR